MVIRAMVAGLSVLAVAMVADMARAESTSPGKNAVYASTANAIVPNEATATTVLTATIEKGKKKRVLEVYGSFTSTQIDTSMRLEVVPVVNGLQIMEPTDGGITVPELSTGGSRPERPDRNSGSISMPPKPPTQARSSNSPLSLSCASRGPVKMYRRP